MSSSKLLSFRNKSKYWDLYRDLYPIMTEKGEGRFPQMFAEEFVKAYERQITEYRRNDRDGTGVIKSPETDSQPVDEDQIKTQVLEPSVVPDESAFDDNEIVDALSQTGTNEIDQSFIEELENSLAEEVPQDQIKA